MTVLIETLHPPDSGQFDIEIKVTANIQIAPDVARRRVSVFVGNHIADLLHGEVPNLVLGENGVYWRVPVVLASRSMGRIGPVGTINVDVETGDLNITGQAIGDFKQQAKRLTLGTAS